MMSTVTVFGDAGAFGAVGAVAVDVAASASCPFTAYCDIAVLKRSERRYH